MYMLVQPKRPPARCVYIDIVSCIFGCPHFTDETSSLVGCGDFKNIYDGVCTMYMLVQPKRPPARCVYIDIVSCIFGCPHFTDETSSLVGCGDFKNIYDGVCTMYMLVQPKRPPARCVYIDIVSCIFGCPHFTDETSSLVGCGDFKNIYDGVCGPNLEYPSIYKKAKPENHTYSYNFCLRKYV